MVDLSMKTDVKVADDVINEIAGISATSVKGVVCLGEGLTFKNIHFMGTRNLKKGIKIIENDDGSITIKLTVTLKSGVEIKKVSSSIQEKIKESIESMLDIRVKDVVVKVAKIDDI